MPEASASNSVPNCPSPPVPIEEFSFVDLALVLVRRGWAILICLLIAWGWLANWYIHAPMLFESRAVIKIGRSRLSGSKRSATEERDRLLEPVEVLALRLREEYGPGCPLGRDHADAFISNVAFDKDADALLTVQARARTPQGAEGFLAAVTTAVIGEHEAMFEPQRRVIRERMDVVEQELDETQEGLAALPSLAPEPSATPDTLRQFSRASLLAQRVSLGQEQFRLRRELLELQVEPTRIVTASTVNRSAVEPKLRFQFLLTTALGLIAGCGLAIVWEFCVQVWGRLKHPTAKTN